MTTASPNTDPYLLVFADRSHVKSIAPLLTEIVGDAGLIRICYDEGQPWNAPSADIPKGEDTPVDFRPSSAVRGAAGLIMSSGVPKGGSLDQPLLWTWMHRQALGTEIPLLSLIPKERLTSDGFLVFCRSRRLGLENQRSDRHNNIIVPTPIDPIGEATLVSWLRRPVVERMSAQRRTQVQS